MTDKTIGMAKRRSILVQLFYRYLLMEANEDFIKQDLLDETQVFLDEETLQLATQLATELPNLKQEAEKHLSQEWKWGRLPYLVQAILLVGTFEIQMTNTPKPVTLNEMTELAKNYGLDQHWKFINALLEKINKI
ncbi:NusB antitermination factor [Entomoplasma freundtii]|uniref:Transcription antitermination protein NusB n=1 Tax=Entomoplasma freundtii TaxID=74700 RepID=A0A2K8NT37_9MOLU|nr:transcription antitermination protein NusB [Entomoplasma freundtii]ATZ16338.1 transcription antitermination protein NusB [Entomoplasma freundtii]TDY56623.1 NusB antitermination factor [Entomoplasma freundtii]